MKKRILAFALCLAVFALFPFSAFGIQTKYVVDTAELLAEDEAKNLNQSLEIFSSENDFDAVVLTVNSLDGKTPEEYADDYYDYNGYKDDGCLLLVSMEDRDWHISTKGFGIEAITDYGINVIEAEVVPYLSSGDYYEAFSTYAGVVEEFVGEAVRGEAFDIDNEYINSSGYTYSADDFSSRKSFNYKGLIFSLIASLVIALIIVTIIKGNYKPVRFKPNAEDYLVDGSLNVTSSYEHFLFSNVTKTKIETESSSGGGSSTHTSSSGSTHGGGGGKF